MTIFDTGRGRLFSSNQTGACVWRCIEQQMPLESIVDKISTEYQIAPRTAREHLAGFLAELENHNLIERGGER